MDNDVLAPIETIYNGYRFRSRLEARWAIFFDESGVKYEYEKEGYDLGDAGWYLPDFYLPEIRDGVFIEVKPESFFSDSENYKKTEKLTLLTKKDSFIVCGDPFKSISKYSDYSDGYTLTCCHNGRLGEDFPYFFCVCPWCLKVGIEFEGRGARVCGYKKHYESEEYALSAIKHLGHWRADDKCYTGGHYKIYNAAMISRQARFEHNENKRGGK
jgi:hypothetical protein